MRNGLNMQKTHVQKPMPNNFYYVGPLSCLWMLIFENKNVNGPRKPFTFQTTGPRSPPGPCFHWCCNALEPIDRTSCIAFIGPLQDLNPMPTINCPFSVNIENVIGWIWLLTKKKVQRSLQMLHKRNMCMQNTFRLMIFVQEWSKHRYMSFCYKPHWIAIHVLGMELTLIHTLVV